MFVAAVFGVPDAALGTVFALAWLGVLGWVGYQYRRERTSRSGFFAQSAMALLWLAWSFFQIAKGTSGGVEAAVELLAVGAFVAAIGVGVQWWRT